jgi:mannosyltransferase OCH1-like enzyme
LLRRALIFPEDVDKYIEDWDENNPDYAGLLNAEILPEET